MILQNPEYGMVNSKLVFFYDFIKLKFQTQDKIFHKKQIEINETSYQLDNKFCKNLLYNKEDITCFGHTEISVPLLFGTNTREIKIDIKQFNEKTDFIMIADKTYPIKNSNIILNLEKSESLNSIKESKDIVEFLSKIKDGLLETYQDDNFPLLSSNIGKISVLNNIIEIIQRIIIAIAITSIQNIWLL